jgi:hypothetical protein
MGAQVTTLGRVSFSQGQHPLHQIARGVLSWLPTLASGHLPCTAAPICAPSARGRSLRDC